MPSSHVLQMESLWGCSLSTTVIAETPSHAKRLIELDFSRLITSPPDYNYDPSCDYNFRIQFASPLFFLKRIHNSLDGSKMDFENGN
ncbi:Hypothetical predicted protein [Octopus vulgaris]|uniref:Uncharacterized protein n=1 Tax=Octopus vulgaris TaxID=6645 RepID=A0AA36F7D8_OCTVU|nr:Hypothetical predicted protein [Octopus vulgaris]